MLNFHGYPIFGNPLDFTWLINALSSKLFWTSFEQWGMLCLIHCIHTLALPLTLWLLAAIFLNKGRTGKWIIRRLGQLNLWLVVGFIGIFALPYIGPLAIGAALIYGCVRLAQRLDESRRRSQNRNQQT